ncbi:MAG TPA: LON peptidase substrate-binding domain-containing protein [Aggregatilineales bacterium]|nr:LON peptidase substrate-binding domain-containing protein [Aggregatilineales bacterium]
MEPLQELPIFPLRTVLFPGMALPLHIFEERYKLLVSECIHNSTPFGVVLIRSGQETEASATFHDVGTTAHITQVERLHDGQMNITTLGYNRFRIRSTHNDKPYVTGMVDYFPLQGQDNPRAKVLARQLGPMLQNYLNVFATLGKVESVEALPEDPMTLAFLTAIILRTPMKDKQILLNIPDLLTLLQFERKMLHREMHILNTLIEHGPRWRDDPKPFSSN